MQHRFEPTSSTNEQAAGAIPAAQQRVTPEELLQALKALESRQAQAGSAAADTIPLGEAVQELSLDLTPEQVWEEVRAQRAIAGVAAVKGGVRRTRRKAYTALLAMTLLTGTMGLLAAFGTRQPMPQPAIVSEARHSEPLLPGFSRLSDVPDGKIVFVDFATLQQVASGESAESINVFSDPKQAGVSQGKMDGLWRIVRDNGHYQAEVWVTPQDGLKLMNRQAARVYGTRPASADLGPIPDLSIRVPVERLLNPQTQMGYGEHGGTWAIDTAPPM